MKKIGLLVCDRVLEPYIPINGTYPDMFAKLLPELELVPYFVCENQFPEDIDACEAYLATGSKYSVYDDVAWIHRLKEFVAQLDQEKKKFVGVCFGHQLLAESTGGKVLKSELGWCVGIHNFRVLQEKDWMQPPLATIHVLMMCQDQVSQLPPDTQVLAQGTNCPYGIIQKGTHMLGIQGHPEFSKAYDRQLMEDRVERMGKEIVGPGLESLKQDLHTAFFSSWITRFLLG